MDRLDQIIVEQYVPFDTPVDQIVGDPKTAERFTATVNAAIRPPGGYDVADVNHRLFTLRKRGADKGGLPRLRRSYRGRKPR